MNALHSNGLVSCGLAHRAVISSVFAESRSLLDARQSISNGREYSEARFVTIRELKASLHWDREIWWFHGGLGIENVVYRRISRILFHLIRDTSRNALGVVETICEADGSPVHNQ